LRVTTAPLAGESWSPWNGVRVLEVDLVRQRRHLPMFGSLALRAALPYPPTTEQAACPAGGLFASSAGLQMGRPWRHPGGTNGPAKKVAKQP
jgi:hypothetical protein